MARKLAEVTGSKTTSDDVADQIATLRKDMAELSGLIADLGKTKGAELSANAKQTAATMRNEAQKKVDAATDQAAQLQGQANDFIKDQPGTALGIAAGLGFLVGFMSGRK